MWPLVHVPVLDLTIPTYGFVRAVYFAIALWLILRLNNRQGIDRSITLTAFALGVPIGLIGARLLDMLEYASHYRSWTDAFGRDGSSIYGAFGAVLLFLWAYCRRVGVSFLRFLDAGAPVMALGEALTRIGCFSNGCCYGRPWNGPWAVTFPPESFAFRDQVATGLLAPTAPHSLPVHPVQLYSMGVMLVVTAALLWWFYRQPPAGHVFFAFLISYGTLRLGVIPVRTEVLSSMIVFSILFVAVGLAGLLLTTRHVPKPAPARAIRDAR